MNREHELLVRDFRRWCEKHPEEAQANAVRSEWHESGHALAATLLLGGVAHATVKPEVVLTNLGKVGLRGGRVEYLPTSRVNQKTIETWAVVYMAGPVAEQLAGVAKTRVTDTLVPRLVELYGYEDDENLLTNCTAQVGVLHRASELILLGRAGAKWLLEENFEGLKAIAAALREKKYLTGDEVRRVLTAPPESGA